MLHYNQVREIHSHLSVLKEKKKENYNENIAVSETEFCGIYGIYLMWSNRFVPFLQKRGL